MTDANSKQIGGSHYHKPGVQLWDILDDYGIGGLEFNVAKYAARHHKKNGLQDILKAGHYVNKLIENHKLKHRKPRGIVPEEVVEQWLRENQDLCEHSANAMRGILTWIQLGDLEDVLEELSCIAWVTYNSQEIS